MASTGGETIDTERSSEPAPSDAKRACDECRARKIKCDKQVPCSGCRQSRRVCVSTGPGQKLVGIRQRVLISSQYEQKLNSFEDRLGSIEHLLGQLSATLSSRSGAKDIPSNASSATARSQIHQMLTSSGDSVTSINSCDPPLPVFEGDSAFSAHATFAHELVCEKALREAVLPKENPQMRSALSTLRQIIQRQNKKSMTNELRFPGKGLPEGGIRGLPLPPSDFALQCLKDMKEKRPRCFDIRCPYLHEQVLADFCRRVYFPTEDYSAAAFILVNGAFFYLLEEKLASGAVHGEAATESKRYSEMCLQNLFAAFSDINPFLTATKENLQALMMGECFAIEASRPLLAWQMNCLAAQTCQTLGYHRLPLFTAPNGRPSADRDDRKELIVFAYMLDKGLALRLGRASAFQDYDILAPSFPTIEEADIDPWELASLFWFRHAQIQGKIYEQLYSSSARALLPEQRARFALRLAEDMKDMIRDAEHLGTFLCGDHTETGDGTTADFDANALQFAYLSEMVTYYGTLCLIYRAIPVGQDSVRPFIPECVEAGRTALQYHMDVMDITRCLPEIQAGYIHWTVLFNPFFPLVMIFCHIVQEQDVESSAADLGRLNEFTASLEPSCKYSDAIQQLHRLSQTLHTIASLYTSARAETTKKAVHSDEPDIHQYLNRLGTGLDETLMPGPMVGVEFGDWYNGDLDIMGLLEEDLSRFCS